MKYFLLNCIVILFLGAFIFSSDAKAAAWGVSNTADTPIGQACAGFTNCSLREAITSTELNPGPDAILVGAGTYVLTNGPLTITQDLTVARVGAGGATISGGNAVQLFIVTGSGTDVIIRFLTLSGGSAATGGVINVGVGTTVGIESSTITASSASSQGGAIFNSGTLTLGRASGSTTNTIISNNSASSGSGQGGGVYNASGATMTVGFGTTFSGNSIGVSGQGGGIYNAGALTINPGTTFSGNGSGGTSNGRAGAIYHAGSSLSITGSTFSGNSANDGGALNIATGALNSSISRSTFNDNSAFIGGAADVLATASFTNCTFSHNNAVSAGGGLLLIGGTITITNCTVTLNSANSGGGLGNSSSTVLLQNTIVAGNTNAAGTTPNDFIGSIDPTSSFNLIGTGGSGGLSNGVNGNQVGVADAKLSSLGSFGGPTSTHAFLKRISGNSTAIDAGSNALAPATDQRGATRPINTTVDIGAFEDTGVDMTPTTLPNGKQGLAYSTPLSGTNGTGPYSFALFLGPLPIGMGLLANGTFTGTPSQSGSFTIEVEVTDSANGLSAVREYTLTIDPPITLTWTGATSTDWNVATNWSPNQIPTAVDSTNIPSAGVTNEPTISAVDVTISELTLHTGRTLTINSGRTLTLTGDTQTIDGSITSDSSNSATVVLTGASLSISGTGGFDTTNLLNVSITGGATVMLGSNMQFPNVTNDSGNLFDITSRSLSVAGSFINNGILIANSSTIIFNGSVAQTATNTTAYNNLTVNNSSSTVALGSDSTVNGILNLSSDLTTTDSFKLTMPASGSSTGAGDVIGTVQRTGFTTGGGFLSFGNPFNAISIDSGTAPSDITVKLTKTAPTDASTGETNSGFAAAVARTYVITPNGGSSISATLKLHYKDSELNGNTESGLNLFRFNSGTGKWENQSSPAFTPGGTTTRDTSNNFVSQSGVTGFSPWTLNSTITTAVKFEKCIASAVNNGTLIEWQTGFEVNNLGFNIYRQTGGQRVKINPSLIAGSALVAGSDVRLEAGESYSWLDDVVNPSASYWLEDIDLNGTSTWHGPFGVSGQAASNTLSRSRSILLNDLNKGGTSILREGSADSMTEQSMAVPASSLSVGSARTNGRTPQKSAPVSAAMKKQWQLAGQSALKIAINKTGWYRVAMTDLMAAGLDAAANANNLQMFVGGVEVPIKVNQDSIEFYGQGLNSTTSDTQVYWLVAGSGTGKRVNTQQAQVSGGGNYAASYPHTVERKDKQLYFSSLRNGDAENWFGPVATTAPALQTLNVHNLDRNSPTMAQLEVALQGVTTGPHSVNVMLNGTNLYNITFEGMTHQSQKIAIPMSAVLDGDNQIAFIAQSGGDASLVDYVRITYAHTYTADNNSLSVGSAGMPVKISGFTSNQIRVVDVASVNQPIELEGTVEGDNGNYSVSVSGAKRGNLLAFSPEQVLRPLSITANQPSMLNTAAGADLVIIATREFTQSVQPLVALRQSQGYQVSVVDVEDVYDEFGYGVHSPDAVKDFLNWTYLHWAKQPQYVMLAGSASLDPKNYTGAGLTDLVPTKLIDTATMETASDDWLIDFNNDGKPQMSIGRLPVRSIDEAAVVVNKIIGYEQTGDPQAVLLVSDLDDGVDFSLANSQIKALIPSGLNTVNIVRGQTEVDAKTQLMDQLSQGQRIVNYAGHGSVGLWRGNLLTSNDVQMLANHKTSPLVVMMTCLNGYFQDPRLASLGESLLKVNNGGAVSVWASSAMTGAENQSTMNQEFFKQLFGSPGITIGEAIKRAKAATEDNDVRRTWILFGDPTMRVKK